MMTIMITIMIMMTMAMTMMAMTMMAMTIMMITVGGGWIVKFKPYMNPFTYMKTWVAKQRIENKFKMSQM